MAYGCFGDRAKPLIWVAHPTRFERVTFAFGGRLFVFAIGCGGLQTYKKPSFSSDLLMDAFARLC